MEQPFKEGVDPRTYLRAHRERGRKKFTYTYDDLAELFGVSVRTLHNWTSAGFDPSDLEDICRRWYERARFGDRG